VPLTQHAIALTIDDGVDPLTTPLILDALQRHGATATFFLVSDSVKGREALVARIVREGHEIGHHMTRDEVSALLPQRELEQKFRRASETLEALGQVAWFRPGSAFFDDRILRLAKQSGYRIALASALPLDTLVRSPRLVADYLAWSARPGSILVLHDVGPRGTRTVETLGILLPRLQRDGYSVTSLTRLDDLAAADRAVHGVRSAMVRRRP
jgi:peptidoglycan/xylan/chitin deacetylase (PgdA/CDA1 family)